MSSNHYSQLIPILNSFWTENYIENSMEVIKTKCLDKYLYDLCFDVFDLKLSKKETDAVAFRSAYVLEHILKKDVDMRETLRRRIFHDFPMIKNESAKRHFCNIMLLLLNNKSESTDKIYPTKKEAEEIAETCMTWIEKPKTKVAVIVNAMDVILKLKDYAEIDKEVISDLIFIIRKESSAGIECRIKKWKSVYGDFY